MPLPDPYQDELTTEIDRDKFKLWQEAKAAVRAWQAEADRLAADLRDSLHGMTAGTIDGRKIVTYRPKDQYATNRLIRDYPDLTSHFMKPKLVDTLDIEAFVAAHPEIADQYRVREFRGLE
jgi:hypothetical protein